MPKYEDRVPAQYFDRDDVRIVTMRPWLEEHWTAEERTRLLDRLELLADSGRSFSIYRPKAPAAATKENDQEPLPFTGPES